MIEIHLVRLEVSAAVDTRDLTEFPNKLARTGLPDSNSVEFKIAVPPVIGNVCWALVLPGRHW